MGLQHVQILKLEKLGAFPKESAGDRLPVLLGDVCADQSVVLHLQYDEPNKYFTLVVAP